MTSLSLVLSMCAKQAFNRDFQLKAIQDIFDKVVKEYFANNDFSFVINVFSRFHAQGELLNCLHVRVETYFPKYFLRNFNNYFYVKQSFKRV